MTKPLTTTVIGDYPKIPNRPKKAKHRLALSRFALGKITREELDKVFDEVTVEVLQEQTDAGLDIITDGQIRWDDPLTYIAQKLEGVEITGLIRYFDTNCLYRQPSAIGEIGWKEPITIEDYRFAKEHSSIPVKPVITGPYTLAKLSVHPYYDHFEDFVMDLAKALNREVLALQDEDPPLIQINEPAITQHKQDVKIFEAAMDLLTHGVTVPMALYTYFGDVRGLESYLQSSPFQTIGLDMITTQENWDILNNDTWDKDISLGVIDARNTKIENWDKLFARLEPTISKYTPERISLNPSHGLEFLPREVAVLKLTHMVNEVKKYLNNHS